MMLPKDQRWLLWSRAMVVIHHQSLHYQFLLIAVHHGWEKPSLSVRTWHSPQSFHTIAIDKAHWVIIARVFGCLLRLVVLLLMYGICQEIVIAGAHARSGGPGPGHGPGTRAEVDGRRDIVGG